MEARLVIFLAFASITLIANTLATWLAYKAFSNLSKKVGEGLREFETNSETHSWLQSLDAAARQAASMTELARRQVENFDPVLARAQNTYGFELAKVDAKVERACDAFTEQVEKTQQAILHPVRKLGSWSAWKSAGSWIA